MASTAHRYSAYSLSDERAPDWLCEPPLSFDDVLRPPSYLIASLQQAFTGHGYEGAPPTYDYSVATSSRTSPRPPSVAHESIWEDDEEDEQEGEGEESPSSESAADEHDGEEAASEVRPIQQDARSVDEQTLLEESSIPAEGLSTFTPMTTHSPSPESLTPPPPLVDRPRTTPSPRPLPPTPYIPPPAYHLLHLHDLMRYERSEKSDPYSGLATCLAALDPPLLLTPFQVFADLCYEASVRGDASPAPLRPFSPSPSPPALAKLPQIPSSSTARAVEDDDDTDDDDLGPTSPTQTFMTLSTVPPLIWDPRVEEHSRSRSDIQMGLPRCLSPVSMMLSSETLSPLASENVPASQRRHVKVGPANPVEEVATLFLKTPVPVKAQDSIHGFPSRSDSLAASSRAASRSRKVKTHLNGGAGAVKGMLLRSLNINHPRWVSIQ